MSDISSHYKRLSNIMNHGRTLQRISYHFLENLRFERNDEK